MSITTPIADPGGHSPTALATAAAAEPQAAISIHNDRFLSVHLRHRPKVMAAQQSGPAQAGWWNEAQDRDEKTTSVAACGPRRGQSLDALGRY